MVPSTGRPFHVFCAVPRVDGPICSCSVVCYNVHLKACPGALEPPVSTDRDSNGQQATSQGGIRQEDSGRSAEEKADEEYRVPAVAFEALKNSDDIRAALRSAELRAIISRIDSAGSDTARIAALRDELELNPRFLEFVQTTVDIVDTTAQRKSGTGSAQAMTGGATGAGTGTGADGGTRARAANSGLGQSGT